MIASYHYEEFGAGIDPRTQDGAIFLQSLIDMPRVGGYINRMLWSVVSLNDAAQGFLTSDRPVIMTDGIKYPRSYIILPIGPNQLFVAVNTLEMEQRLKALPQRDLVRCVNGQIALQAQKYVYGTDDRLLRFIENRLGKA